MPDIDNAFSGLESSTGDINDAVYFEGFDLEIKSCPERLAHLYHCILQSLILQSQHFSRLSPIKDIRILANFIVRSGLPDRNVLEVWEMFVDDLPSAQPTQ